MKRTLCGNCSHPADDIAHNMVNGCPKCGEKKIVRAKNAEVHKREDNSDENIGIFMKGKGEYVFNLKALTNRINDKDPLFIADSQGKINVLFNTED